MMVVRLVQFSKAYSFMSATLLPITTVVRLLQLLNVQPSMVVMLSGIVIAVSFLQFSKAFAAISRVFLGIEYSPLSNVSAESKQPSLYSTLSVVQLSLLLKKAVL